MTRRLLVALLVCSVVAAGVAGADARGEPSLVVALSERTVDPGEETTLRLTVANEGDLVAADADPSRTNRVTTARAVRVRLQSDDAPLTVETRERLLGSLAEGAAADVPFEVSVDADAEPGTYRLPVVVEYAYADQMTSDGFVDEETGRLRTTVRVRVAEAARFAVVGVETDVRSGERGTVSLTLENTGTAAARNASVAVASATGDVLFGGTVAGDATGAEAREASQFVGEWAPGERRTLTYGVTTATARSARTYTLQARVTYRDGDGRDRGSRDLSVGVSPAPTPTFAVENVTADLRVGERGRLAATVRNRGETTVRNVAVAVEPPGPGFHPTVGERAIGTLDPDDTARVVFPVDVAEGVESGDRQITLRTRYEAGEGETATAPAATLGVTVAAEREPFALTVRNGTVAPDTDDVLAMDVTNVGEVTRTNVVLRLESLPPLSSAAPTAYVARLEPGETARVSFALSTDEDAVAGAYPVWVNVTADTPNREGVRDGPYLRSVTVQEDPAGDTDLSLVALAAFIAVVLLGAGWWWLRG